GDHAHLRVRGNPGDRRTFRRRGLLRPHRLRGARLGLRTPGPAHQPGTDRGLPPGAVLDGRNADLPGRDRPTDAVHRTGGTLPAAVRAQRTGAPPSSPLPGSLTEVL